MKDHNQLPCGDYDGPLPQTTGEYKIPWPPVNVHRHPSTFAEPMFALGCTFAFLALMSLAALGVLTVMQWLF